MYTTKPNCFDIGKNFLFIGTHDCTVKVFKNTQPPKKWQKYCFFQTGALVTQVEYNKAGDYVATVEKKVSRQSEVVSVKVYLNWHIAHQSDSYRTRVRVAGLGYKSSNVQTGKRLEVVDVPIEGKVSAMSTCAETGNLVFACNHIAKLFHLVEKTIPNSEETFLDMIVFLEISFGYDLTKICLCEEFLVCSSSQFVQVFEVQIRDRVDDMQGRSVDSQGPSPRRMKASSVLSSLNIAQNISSPETVRERTVPVIREQPKFSAVGERGSSTPSPGPSFPSKNTTSLIEDDTDFVQWSFSSNPLARKSTGLAGAQLHGYHDNKTIKLKGLENLGKPARFEPPVPDIKDLRETIPGMSDAPGWQSCLPYCIMSELNVQEMVSNIRQRKKEYKLVEGDTLLETCFEAMPDRLSDVLLFSRIRTYSAETAINFLKKTSKYIRPSDSRSSTKYRLALASLNLQLCEPDMALGLLSAIDKRELVDLCVENHHILHVAMTEFSPLAQGRSNVPEAHKNSHLMAYLEALVCDEKRKFCFEDAVPKGGHFGRRHGWLDQLPPFSGTQSITTTCQYVVPSSESRRAGKQSQQWLQCQKTDNVTCSCFMCNEDLLKIQSLLCYPEVSSTVCDRVLPLLEANKHHTFSPSLNILCQVHTDIDAAVRLVIESHMTVAAEFGASVLKSDVDKWEKLLNKMLEKVFKAEEANQSTEEFMPCVKDVLAEMSKHLKPEEFLKVLPGNGNFFFFMPYIQQCLAIHKEASGSNSIKS
ncbi:hypothetical protein MAR_020743 [Mya arenaria]|uniref:Uncharacterized protein n=1 Tax=Mya arenaria TaxID=6604 RepID=A0ABY7EAD5_MYAAR|nr:hypothetical protein MAR_020743 [Mya arenaria]